MFIMLQRLSEDEKTNLGGLYVNVEHISAVYHMDGETRPLCMILLSNGDEFSTVQTIAEVLNEIIVHNKRKTQFG